ncbi:MAG: aminoacyl-tRNA hydrolase [Phycisphaeraceae bacterium]|nr:aminoacyl-tRNA hydrolase [Phycisphaeraceae bacterium]
MKLIVGLGNPGSEYERTRHNAGFMALDRLARRHAAGATPRARFEASVLEAPIRGEKCLLMKPTTFMNRSGSSVAQAAGFFKVNPLADIFVMVDDSAIPLGSIRVRPDGGPGGHNGLADIQRALGGDAYVRCRIGIDPPPPPMSLHDYVLGRFTTEQESALAPALDKAADAAEIFVSEGVVAAMNRFNTRAKPSAPPAQEQSGAA